MNYSSGFGFTIKIVDLIISNVWFFPILKQISEGEKKVPLTEAKIYGFIENFDLKSFQYLAIISRIENLASNDNIKGKIVEVDENFFQS